MIPQTVGRKYDVGKIASIQCVKNDSLKEIDVKGQSFLLLIVYAGTAVFQIKDKSFEATGPCFVCFDEREQPKLVRKNNLKCDAVYFHPVFLNINMTFQLVHSGSYEQVATSHDLFLLRPFTDEKRYVFPLFEEYIENISSLFSNLLDELHNQRDWYWSCRSRSYFIEIILLLERAYGIIGKDDLCLTINTAVSPHLKSALVYIESHYKENIKLGNITKAVSINHTTLTRLFKEEFSMTVIEYLWNYRICVAKKQLEFTNLPVKDIALRCGFKTVQHFCRKFELATNTTPTCFREVAITKRKASF